MKPVAWMSAASVLAAIAVHAAGGYEAPPTFKASQLLPATAIKGPHHRVEEQVPLRGIHRQYRITSDYGPFEANGDSLLVVRLKEVDALARLAGTSEAVVALKGVGGAIGGAVAGTAHAVTHPVQTVAGIPGGIGRMFGRIGHSAKSTAQKATSKEPTPAPSPNGPATSPSAGAAAADSAVKSVLGISAGRRRWAKELGVDPYTSNTVLGAALDKVGQIDSAARFTTKLVPGVAALSAMASVNALVYDKSPEELLKYNDEHLKAMGVSASVSRELQRNKNLRPGLQARIVVALDALSGVADRAAFLERVAAVDSEAGAFYFADSAEMLERFHRTQAPLTRIVPAQAAAVALTKDGRLVHLVPADFVPWTQPVAQAVDTAAQRAKQEFGTARPELWITGESSARTRQELAARGWGLHPASLRAAGLLTADK